MFASFLFLNPFTMIVGGALIASPIIIHLINRMRFKRIRWAAMEFLLKSQKRSRRKLIIEQMILLLLRILLVLLLALLLARLIEQKPTPPPDPASQDKPPPVTTRHVIILDDSASMADRFRDRGGQEIVAFDQARFAILTNIVDYVRESNEPHQFTIINLSQTDKEPHEFFGLNEASRADIEEHVRNRSSPQPFHYDLLPALKQAEEIFKRDKGMNLVLHVVSDFRSVDWNDATKDSLGAYFDQFQRALVQVKLHDVSSPLREAGDKALVFSDNLAIVDFRPESLVAIKDFPIEFTVTIANYSNSDKVNVFVRVKVNNEEKRDGSVNIPLIRANDSVTARVAFSLSRTAPKDPNVGEPRKFDGFNLVSAQIENETEGLAVDNVRYCFVEVRDKVPILLVDNNIADRFTKRSESFYLWKLFSDTFKGFDVQVKTAADLEKTNLQNYSAVILCDIPTLVPATIQKLETYVNDGGGVGFFMGSSIRDPAFYNQFLYKDGKGLFPAPLKEVANKQASPDELNKILLDQLSSFNKKLLVRKEMRRHPALEKLYADSRGQNFNDDSYEKIFYLVAFARYFIVDRPKWKANDNVQTLLYLPNNRSIADFERPTKDLIRKLKEMTDETTRRGLLQQRLDMAADDNQKNEIKQKIEALKGEMEKYARYQKVLKDYTDTISNTVGKYDNPLHKLVLWLEVLLEDPGDDKSAPPIPSMIQFWQFPELSEIKQEFLQLLDVIKYGDPFYMAKQFGKGRVLAFMGSAGASGPEGDYWNPLNKPGREYYPPLMKDSLQRYLCSAGGDFFLPLGKPFDFDKDPLHYEPVVNHWFVQENDKPASDEDKVKFTALGLQPLEPKDNLLQFKFASGKQAGMYLFEFAPKTGDAPKKDYRPDIRALAYNFDGRLESNLARARTDDLLAIAHVEKVETVDVKAKPRKIAVEKLVEFKPEESDLGLSKNPWLYLGMLIVLILEQAWAVRLSFHVRNAGGPASSVPVNRRMASA